MSLHGQVKAIEALNGICALYSILRDPRNLTCLSHLLPEAGAAAQQ